MRFWQRRQYRARLRAIRGDLDRISQRITETEQRITQIATRLESLRDDIRKHRRTMKGQH